MNILKRPILSKQAIKTTGFYSDGFTLTEILISVAVVGLLLAICLPLYGVMTTRAQGVRCVNNLKSLHVGVMAYAADHQQEIPADYDNKKSTVMSWYRPLVFEGYIPHPVYGPQAYSSKLMKAPPLFCPANKAELKTAWTNYAINSNFYPGGYNLEKGFDDRKPLRLNAIRSGCVLLMDSYQLGGAPFDTWYIQGGGRVNPSWVFTDPIHQQRVNVIFVDGHVESPKVFPRVINSSTKDLGDLKSEWFSPVL